MTAKDPSLERLIARLQLDLGPGEFDVVDHWESDLLATGIALPQDHRVLVYVCVQPGRDRFFAERELSPEPGSDMPYRVIGESTAVTYATLLELIRDHLANNRSGGAS